VNQSGEWAINQPKLRGTEAIMSSLVAAPRQVANAAANPQQHQQFFIQESTAQQQPQPLGRLLNWGLAEAMLDYPEIVLAGEDIGPKGGVYQVTQSLQRYFGPQRVINTLLDEQTILGLAIGLSHHALVPIPEIQFLAYVHNAEDQIRGEAATLSFFSNGQYANPMLIRIAGLGYQKGFGGHFHNDNSLAVFGDIPGLILACPSNGEDALLMLRECIRLVREEQRLVVFIEPISLYKTRDLLEPGDDRWCCRYSELPLRSSIPFGQPYCHGKGTELCLLSYGNGYYLCRQAAIQLQQQGIDCRVVDLRWLKPLNLDAIREAIQPCNKLLIVDECRRSGSLAEQLVAEFSPQFPRDRMARHNAADSFIPLGPGASDTLPSVESIMTAAKALISTAT
ncbi:MAG: transketolase C-terminal domain-containing protein, partial [Halopseudomonas sp.]